MDFKSLRSGYLIGRIGAICRLYSSDGKLVSIRRFKSPAHARRYLATPVPLWQIAIAAGLGAIMGTVAAFLV